MPAAGSQVQDFVYRGWEENVLEPGRSRPSERPNAPGEGYLLPRVD